MSLGIQSMKSWGVRTEESLPRALCRVGVTFGMMAVVLPLHLSISGCGASTHTTTLAAVLPNALVVNSEGTSGAATGFDQTPIADVLGTVRPGLAYNTTHVTNADKQAILSSLPGNQVVYYFGHCTTVGGLFVYLHPSPDLLSGWDPTRDISSAEIGGLSCTFVFLNGCASAMPGSPGLTGFSQNFFLPRTRHAYLGWTANIAGGDALGFAQSFFSNCNLGRAVGQAAAAAYNPLTMPIYAFVGDVNLIIDCTPSS